MQKDGIKTTEFWMTVGAIVLSVIEDGFNISLPKEPLYAIIAYVLSRGWVKTNASKAECK
jgi:hypothetical protein